MGLQRADDAAVYKLRDDLAIVQTIDFITPIVNDPHSFGMIAAANALSDVYAMGAEPVTAMNVVCFPSGTLDIEVLQRILGGALAKMDEAGVTLVGGHSIKDEELKYGLSVTGTVHPQKIITKSEAKPGDKLILTKPLGTGILSTALKAGRLGDKTLQRLTEQMAMLNMKASRVMVSLGAHACTDVTGFGLLGHACEMAQNSGVAVELFCDRIPLISEVVELAGMGLVPKGMYDNREFRAGMTHSVGKVADFMLDILCDPQTSGGLLISVSPSVADKMLDQLRQVGYKEAAIIGQVVDGPESKVILL